MDGAPSTRSNGAPSPPPRSIHGVTHRRARHGRSARVCHLRLHESVRDRRHAAAGVGTLTSPETLLALAGMALAGVSLFRSEERRVGKGWRSGWARDE